MRKFKLFILILLLVSCSNADNEWIYLCEDDYLHTPYSFEYLTEFIENKDKYLETSSKKKNYINKIIGNLKNKPIIIFN